MLSIYDTLLAGKYEGTTLNTIRINADCQLVPLAFAIVEKENNISWDWFLRLVWRVVVGPTREICLISDNMSESLMSYVR
jgi:hypothetical protein